MADSMEQTIEIRDCDELVFKEYLRFIYYNEILELDANLAIKLISYSDKYLQEDLYEKCMSFLTYNISIDNVYTILDFAREAKISPLQNWCLKFLKNNVTIDDISILIKYLKDQQQLPKSEEFAKENLELKNKALYFIMENYARITQKEVSFKVYEDFLSANLTTTTNGMIAKFIYGQDLKGDARKAFQKDTANLKDSLSDFVKKNFPELKKKHATRKFPEALWEDLVSCLVERLGKLEKRKIKQAEEIKKFKEEKEEKEKKEVKKEEKEKKEEKKEVKEKKEEKKEIKEKKEDKKEKKEEKKEKKEEKKPQEPEPTKKRKPSVKKNKKPELEDKSGVFSLVKKLCTADKKKMKAKEKEEKEKDEPPKSKKRKEPAKQEEEPEEKPELKKTKKAPAKKASFL